MSIELIDAFVCHCIESPFSFWLRGHGAKPMHVMCHEYDKKQPVTKKRKAEYGGLIITSPQADTHAIRIVSYRGRPIDKNINHTNIFSKFIKQLQHVAIVVSDITDALDYTSMTMSAVLPICVRG